MCYTPLGDIVHDRMVAADSDGSTPSSGLPQTRERDGDPSPDAAHGVKCWPQPEEGDCGENEDEHVATASLRVAIGDVTFGMEDGAVSVAGLAFGASAGTSG